MWTAESPLDSSELLCLTALHAPCLAKVNKADFHHFQKKELVHGPMQKERIVSDWHDPDKSLHRM